MRSARRWPVSGAVWSLSAALSLLACSTSALAQSSVGAPINAATGSSTTDAVKQNEKELIDREVLGRTGGDTAGGALGSISTFSTGRLRWSDHDALRKTTFDNSNGPYPYDTHEYSAFANVVVALPGTVLGGQVKTSAFIGRNVVSIDIKSDALHVLDPWQSGSARNDSLLAGGTLLWSMQNTYALATAVGTLGQTTLKDSADDCYTTGGGFANDFCHHNRYNFNTAGFIGTLTAGQVFDLGGKSGPKLDLRGSLGYTHNQGDRFTNTFGDQQQYTFSMWTGTATATLFSNLNLSDNALLRPYIAAYIRQEWDYRNELNAVQSDGTPLGTAVYEQKHTYGGVDAGLTYTLGASTYGAAIYYEGSGDERTLGGRLGFSQKLDGTAVFAPDRPLGWSGLYVGVSGGGAWGRSRIGTSVECIGAVDGVPDFNCPFTTADEVSGSTSAAALNAAGSSKLSDHTFTGSAQAGYNLQVGGFVFGLEIDAGSFNLGASRSATALGQTVTTSFDTEWLFTARSRIGVPLSPSLLLYATSGLGLTNISVANAITSIGAGSKDGLVAGWVAGAGAEWALSRNWTLRGEYLFLDFGSVSVNTPSILNATQLANDYNSARTTADLSAQILRFGLNYRF
jgi:outer membrane immunogenic protein